MRRNGQAWRLNSTGEYFNLLVSDIAVHYGGHPGRMRYANHSELQPEYEAGPYWRSTNQWATPQGSYLYPKMGGNFGAQDGSVRHYVIPDANTNPDWGTNFRGVANNVFPLDFLTSGP